MFEAFSKKDNQNKKTIYIIGAILGVATTILTMFIFATLLLVANLDRSYSAPFATISVSTGCFIASLYTAKKSGSKGYMIGLVIGVTVFVIITLLSLIIGENGLSLNTLFHFIIILLSSLVGGVLGVNSKKSKKYI